MEDSREATLDHIEKVEHILSLFSLELKARGACHDKSKLKEPEKSLFDEWSPKLSAMEYGSDEYMNALAHLGPALDHHYRHNNHHPEHYQSGVTGMTLFDILEMLADWKAATERMKDGSIEQSLKFNVKRFKIPRSLALVIANTAEDFGWIEHR